MYTSHCGPRVWIAWGERTKKYKLFGNVYARWVTLARADDRHEDAKYVKPPKPKNKPAHLL